MGRTKMFKKGEAIKSLDELNALEYIYWNHKIMHYAFLTSMPYRVVVNALKKGIIFKALRNE